jgi:hypothetical protein
MGVADTVTEVDLAVMRGVLEDQREVFIPRGGPCVMPSCAGRKLGWGLCRRHYKAALRVGMIPVLTAEQRFWRQVKRPLGEGCWEWQGSLRDNGYGQLTVDGRVTKAHRHAWVLVNGPIPRDLFVLHRCDNPRCVRAEPAGLGHLFLGTHQDNMDDMHRKRIREDLLVHARMLRAYDRATADQLLRLLGQEVLALPRPADGEGEAA